MILEKVIDRKDNDSGRFYKIYKTENSYDIMGIIERLKESQISISNIYVNEDADIGMKRFEGNYSLEDFISLYPQLNKEDLKSVVVDIDGQYKIYISNGNYISFTSAMDVELEEFINSKKMSK